MPVVLPELGAVIAAGFLLLIAAALWVLIRMVVNPLSHVPLVGGWIGRSLGSWLEHERASVVSEAKSSFSAAAHLVNWLSNYLWTMIDKVLSVFVQTASTFEWLSTTKLPDLLRAAESYAFTRAAAAQLAAEDWAAARLGTLARALATEEARATALYHDATAYAGKLVSAAEKTLAADITAAERAAAAGTAAAERTLSHAITSVASAASADIAALAAQANGSISQLARDIITSEQAVAAAAAANLAAVQQGIYTDLEQWGDQAVSHVWPDAAQDIAGLQRTLGGDFPWLNDLAGALGGLGAAGLAGALVRSIAGTEAITRLAEECIIPNCRNLSGFGNMLNDLLGAASLAALMAFIAEGVDNPGGWARDVQAVADPLGRRWAAAGAGMFGAP